MNSSPVQHAKTLVRHFWENWPSPDANARRPLEDYYATDTVWRGPHPPNDLMGCAEVHNHYWDPLLSSFPNLHRRMDIFLGGECEGQIWISSAGYLFGTFAQDWLGIPATQQRAFIRYGEFCRVENEHITQTNLLLDLPFLMFQSGYDVLPPSAGLYGFVPPPRTGDGLLFAEHPDSESEKTFQLAYTMLFGGLNSFNQANKESMGMRGFWHPNVHWYGPHGIGTTRTIKEFEDNHQMPWLRAFPDRKVVWEPPMFGEGQYAATAGWREVVGTHTGPYLGHPASGNAIEFRVMDWWRREDNLLSENWVLIDLVDVFKQFGTDLFERLRQQIADRAAQSSSAAISQTST